MENNDQLAELLKDLVKINAVIATEMIQLVENSSRQIRGAVPETCLTQHAKLKQEVVEIAEKWERDCDMLRNHNLKHE
jgi:uncharacterized protein YcsI (UPF0317 family)